MRATCILLAATLAASSLACGKNNGPPEPTVRPCIELGPDDCAERADCLDVLGQPLRRTPSDEWCADPADGPVVLACETFGRGGIAVITYLRPLGDPDACYVFNAPFEHDGSWVACVGDPASATPCP